MNILVINQYAGSKKHGMVYRHYYMAKEWVQSGHSVAIISGSYSHARSIQPNKKSEIIDGIKYIWLSTPKYKGNNLGRVLNIFTFIFKLGLALPGICTNFSPDVIISSSTHNLDIFLAKRFARKYRAKLIYEVRDLWPLSPIQIGGMSPDNPFIKFVQRAEDFAYRNSDITVSLMPKTFEYMKYHGLEENKFVYIPNGIDPNEWEEAEVLDKNIRNTILSYKAKSKVIIGYAGAHGKANALEALIKAACKFDKKDVCLILVGNGLEKENLIKEYSHLNNIVFVDAIPKNQVASLIELFDVCYIGLINQPLFKYGISPNKVLDYMMSAKPVIYAINSGNDPAKESGGGFSVQPENIAELVKTLDIILKTPKKDLAEMGKKGKQFVLKNHTYKELAKKYLSILEG